jgi:predicted nucleic acid-binding protein
MRAVGDTNILISGLLFSGLPRAFLNCAAAQGFSLITSEELLDELNDTLANKFRLHGADTRLFLEKIRQIAEVASPNFRLT